MKKFICIVLAVMALILAGSSPGNAFRGGHGGGGYGGHGGGGYGWHGGGGYGWHGGGWHGGHGGVGVWLGPGWGPGWWGSYYPYYPYYPYSPYYAEPPVVIEREPDTYIQQIPQTPQAEEPSYWYFCPNPKGYYPYVKKCPKGWQKVVPPPTPEEEEE
jgi:hypothetical protein